MGGFVVLLFGASPRLAALRHEAREAVMCFVHSGSAEGGSLIQQTSLAAAAATASSTLAAGGGMRGEGEVGGGMDVAASGSPDVVAGPGGARVLDGYGQILHTRWNRDLPPAATVRPGEVIQLLCRDAVAFGVAARTLTPEASLTLDLGREPPLTGPVEVEGAEPGDILEVEVLDVAPLVDFGYVVIGPALGMFGSLRPDVLAPITQFTEASQISDPNPGPVPGAIPADQPYNSGSPFVQLFTFERGQNTGFATFVGAATGRRARIPVAPFLGIYRVAPLRKGMYPTLPPRPTRPMGGDAHLRQFTNAPPSQSPLS